MQVNYFHPLTFGMTVPVFTENFYRVKGRLFQPNQFQKKSNSVPLIGQKNIFCPISGTEFDLFWNWFVKNKFPGALLLLK